MKEYIIDIVSREHYERLKNALPRPADSLHPHHYSIRIQLTEEEAEALRRLPGVLRVLEYVPDILDLHYNQTVEIEEDKEWALARICQADKYQSPLLGSGCDIVIYDTGLNPFHEDYACLETAQSPILPNRYNPLLFYYDLHHIDAVYANMENYFYDTSIFVENNRIRYPVSFEEGYPNIPVADVALREDDSYTYTDITLDSESQEWTKYAQTKPNYQRVSFLRNFPNFYHIYYGVQSLLDTNAYISPAIIGFADESPTPNPVFTSRTTKGTVSLPQPWNPEVHTGWMCPLALDMNPSQYLLEPDTQRVKSLAAAVWYNPRKAAMPFLTRSLIQDILPLTEHGALVAGCAAGTKYGIAKHAGLLNLPCFNIDIADAVEKLLEYHRAKIQEGIRRPTIVNCSFGLNEQYLSTYYDYFYDAFEMLAAAGIVVIASAGNSSKRVSRKKYQAAPATFPFVITVGATNIDNNLAYFTNYGSGVDLFAPGFKVKTTAFYTSLRSPNNPLRAYFGGSVPMWQYFNNWHQPPHTNQYASTSGTSFSSPYTAGVAAIALEAIGNPVFQSYEEVIQFKQFFLENFTRSFSPKYFTLYKQSFTSEQYYNPDNWADGFPPDDIDPELEGDTGSPNRILFLAPRVWIQNRRKVSFDYVEGLQVHFGDSQTMVFTGPHTASIGSTVIQGRNYMRINNKLYRIDLCQ